MEVQACTGLQFHLALILGLRAGNIQQIACFVMQSLLATKTQD